MGADRFCPGCGFHLPTRRVDSADTLLSIVQHAADALNVTIDEVLSPSRSKSVASARHVAAYIMRHDYARSLPEIARALGRTDHTTAMSGIARVARSPELLAIVERVRRGRQAAA